MSSELKTAAQQAVDAFDAFGDADDFASLFELTRKMHALRTAIQQEEAQQPATGEPVAWLSTDSIGERYLCFAKPTNDINAKPLVHPAPSVPDGHALVPIEPTEAMLNVQTWDVSRFYSPREIWAAMLAAK